MPRMSNDLQNMRVLLTYSNEGNLAQFLDLYFGGARLEFRAEH
jgi:hypothetical protein